MLEKSLTILLVSQIGSVSGSCDDIISTAFGLRQHNTGHSRLGHCLGRLDIYRIRPDSFTDRSIKVVQFSLRLGLVIASGT